MRTQVINRTPFYYALYSRTEPRTDDEGYLTGEDKIFYHTPVLYKRANISPATGRSDTEQFGQFDNYDKVIVTSDMSCPIDENSVLWIDDTNTRHAYDYVVKRVARSLNGISIAVAKVKSSWEDSSLYPHNGLFPSETLFPRELSEPPWGFED